MDIAGDVARLKYRLVSMDCRQSESGLFASPLDVNSHIRAAALELNKSISSSEEVEAKMMAKVMTEW